jgi:hypothetical protein
MLFPSDDVMKIRNFDSLKLMYQKDSNLAMTNQIQVYMNEYGHALKTVFIPPDTKLMSVFALPILFSQNFLAAPGSTFRSSVFKQEYLGSNTSQIQDWCLGIQLRIRGNIRTGTCGYMLYRQHPGAISSKANYLQTHIEWYNFMREFIQHDLPLYTNSLSEFKKRIFCHFTKFYSRDKPNCSHKIELLLLIAKVCDQKDSQIQRVSFEECLKYQFIQRIYKVKKSSKILERIVYMIVMKDFVSLNKILIMMSTYFFLMKRTIRCLLS